MSLQDILYQNQKYIVDQIKQGISTCKIGKQFNCNPGTIWYFLDSIGVKPNKKRSKNYGNMLHYKDKITELLNQGNSIYRIGQILNIPKGTIRRFCQTHNLQSQHKSKLDPHKLTLKSRLNEAVQLFNDGKNCTEISKIMGYSGGQVSTLLKKHGYDTSNKTYVVNENFFQKINAEENAYILGWFYSDGNVMPDGKIRICLANVDEEILVKIRDAMKYDGPLYYKQARNENCYPQVELCINRKVLANQLIELGCIPNKSLTLKFPNKDQVPEDMLCHFVRGYFDGDGSIGEGLSIIGSYEFTYKLQDILPCKITNIYQRYKDKQPQDSAHQLFIGRNKEIKKLYHWFYDGANLFLSRKKRTFAKRVKI